MSEKNEDDPFRTKSVTPNEENSEQSFETVIQYNTTSNGFWTQSTPVKPFGRKTLQRKSMKRKSNASGLYPEISVYPDLGNMEIPSTSNQDFGRVANGILEEMNNRIAGTPYAEGAKKSQRAKLGGHMQSTSTYFQGYCRSSQRITVLGKHHKAQVQRCPQQALRSVTYHPFLSLTIEWIP